MSDTQLLSDAYGGDSLTAHLDAVHSAASDAAADTGTAVPARVRVEALRRTGTSLEPHFDLALGGSTLRRAIANLGAAPAFGGWTGQFYRLTASAGLIVLWGFGLAAIYGGLPHPLAYAAFAAAAVYVAIQPVLGVWARATLRPGRLEIRDVDGDSDLGRIIGCYRHVMDLSSGFARIGDARALVDELRRMLWEAVLLQRQGNDEAVAKVHGHFSSVTATLEGLVLGRSPVAQAAATAVVERERRERTVPAGTGLRLVAERAAAQARAVVHAPSATLGAVEAVRIAGPRPTPDAA